MSWQEDINYNRIAEAINYISTHFRQQPDLNSVAEKMHLSPAHFQRLFSEWAGVSPKKFLQYMSIEYAKNILQENKQMSLFDAVYDTGLSGKSRLHDLFVNIEGMTPAEYKNGGRSLTVNYSFATSLFGNLLVASTYKGVCYLAFVDDNQQALDDLISRFPNAEFQKKSDLVQQSALTVFQKDWGNLPEVKLHLKGTDFQLKVWECLLKIPMGNLSTYGSIAKKIGHPKASRAVGTSVGDNPVAFLIPCHRVIQSSGLIGGYMWGQTRKKAIIGWEAARVNK